jgi:hypothetical protein
MAGKGKKQFVENIKQGFQDMKVVMQEGNLKLFAKQIVVIVLMFFALRYANGKFQQAISLDKKQIAAIDVQKKSERDYLASKKKLISLEPRFPDVDQKNEWLLSHIIGIYKEAGLTPQMEGAQQEDEGNSSYLAASQKVLSTMSYIQLGKFLELIENARDYLRISDVEVIKNGDPNAIGENKITLIFHTIFPKEKVGATLFSNYAELVAEQQKKEEEK